MQVLRQQLADAFRMCDVRAAGGPWLVGYGTAAAWG